MPIRCTEGGFVSTQGVVEQRRETRDIYVHEMETQGASTQESGLTRAGVVRDPRKGKGPAEYRVELRSEEVWEELPESERAETSAAGEARGARQRAQAAAAAEARLKHRESTSSMVAEAFQRAEARAKEKEDLQARKRAEAAAAKQVRERQRAEAVAAREARERERTEAVAAREAEERRRVAVEEEQHAPGRREAASAADDEQVAGIQSRVKTQRFSKFPRSLHFLREFLGGEECLPNALVEELLKIGRGQSELPSNERMTLTEFIDKLAR